MNQPITTCVRSEFFVSLMIITAFLTGFQVNVLSCASGSLSPCAIFHPGLLFAVFGDLISLTSVVILLTPSPFTNHL